MKLLIGTEIRKDVPSIELPEFNGDLDIFKEDLENLARRQINNFFREKKLYCGGPIPNSYLMSDSSITTVVCSKFADGIQSFYEVITSSIPKKPFELEGEDIDHDIYYFLTLLHETHRCNVWIKFRAGMILLYLKLCKGYKIPSIPYDISHYLESASTVEEEESDFEEKAVG